jgi:small membrane protein
MNLFQILAIGSLSVVMLGELARLAQGRISGGVWLVRTTIWLAALVAITRPLLLQSLANLLGIGRGTDVLLYGLVFVFLGTSFFLYSRTVLLQRQVTELIRRYALDNAQKRS